MPRARDLDVPFDGFPGPNNAITDVKGTLVGHRTLICGEGPLRVGHGPVRTGVTAILPRGRQHDPVFAGCFTLNGNGEMTGTIWLEESGFLAGPVMITNTHSIGVVHDSVIAWLFEKELVDHDTPPARWVLPVVGETYDGRLNDINGFHVRREHVYEALDSAAGGAVDEGNVGGGTGMICHGFKGGIGTASRLVTCGSFEFTLGVLVQSNYGSRRRLTIAGVPVGREITDLLPEIDHMRPPADLPEADGSIIVIVATDAPLLPHQLKRLARRVPLGIGRMGGTGANSSGDLFLAYSTANPGASDPDRVNAVKMLANGLMTPLFEATIQATEEAIVNSMVAAETMTGINNNTVYALPHDRLREVLRSYNRMAPAE